MLPRSTIGNTRCYAYEIPSEMLAIHFYRQLRKENAMSVQGLRSLVYAAAGCMVFWGVFFALLLWRAA